MIKSKGNVIIVVLIIILSGVILGKICFDNNVNTEHVDAERILARQEVADVVPRDYFSEYWKEIKSHRTDALSLMKVAKDIDTITYLKDQFFAFMDKYEKRETVAKKMHSELKNYLNTDNYYEEQQKEISDILSLYKIKMLDATSKSKLKGIVSSAKKELDSVLTKPQYDQKKAEDKAKQEAEDQDKQENETLSNTNEESSNKKPTESNGNPNNGNDSSNTNGSGTTDSSGTTDDSDDGGNSSDQPVDSGETGN